MWDYPISHDDTQNLEGVLVVYKAELLFFLLVYVQLINDTVIYIIESKLTKLKEK